MLDINKIFEDAMMAAGDCGGDVGGGDIMSGGDIPANDGLQAGDVLGNCDHHKDGYFGPGCFHVPSKVFPTLKRYEIPAGKKKKGHKNPYAKGMMIAEEDFEDRSEEQ